MVCFSLTLELPVGCVMIFVDGEEHWLIRLPTVCTKLRRYPDPARCTCIPAAKLQREISMLMVGRLRGRHRRLFRETKLIDADRTKRVKEARDEAKKEIDSYKKTKDDEFKKFESEHTSGNKKAEEDAGKDAETKMKEIKSAGKKGQDPVIKDLLKAVFDVKPEVPDRVEVPK
ncbi:hypothetical protein JHW43_004847 [Diplocarpon mali]|nr:hypothetical protein JHW43_004847 [Diplocarpon mali]